MSKKRHITKRTTVQTLPRVRGYDKLVSEISGLMEQARRGTARAVNAILTATYWEIGRRIVEHEQGGSQSGVWGELTHGIGQGLDRQSWARVFCP